MRLKTGSNVQKPSVFLQARVIHVKTICASFIAAVGKACIDTCSFHTFGVLKFLTIQNKSSTRNGVNFLPTKNRADRFPDGFNCIILINSTDENLLHERPGYFLHGSHYGGF